VNRWSQSAEHGIEDLAWQIGVALVSQASRSCFGGRRDRRSCNVL